MERIGLDIVLQAARHTRPQAGGTNLISQELTQGDTDAHTIRARVFDGGKEISYPAAGEALFVFSMGKEVLAALRGRILASSIECDLSRACCEASGLVNCCLTLTDGEKRATLSQFCYRVNPNPASNLESTRTDTSDATAQASDIRKDATAYSRGIKLTGELMAPDTSDATAAAYDIVAGKTAYNALGKVTGTLIPGGDLDITDATANEFDIVAGKIAYGHGMDGKYKRLEGKFYAGEPELSALTLRKASGRFMVENSETLMLRRAVDEFELIVLFEFLFIRVLYTGQQYIGGYIDGLTHYIHSDKCEGLLPEGLYLYANEKTIYIQNNTGETVTLDIDAYGTEAQ